MNRTAHRWMQKPWFSALLLAALACRALTPVGFMPGIGADGNFSVVLCEAYAPVMARDVAGMPDMPAMADMVGMAHDGGHGQHQAQGSCPYAGASTGVALVQTAMAVLLPQAAYPTVIFPPERLIPRGTIAPTRLPRGPPSLA